MTLSVLTTFFFVDDNFAIDRQHAIEVCRALKSFQDAEDTHINGFTQTDLLLKRTLTLHEFAKLIRWIPRAILSHGSLSVMGFVANIVNFSTFARAANSDALGRAEKRG